MLSKPPSSALGIDVEQFIPHGTIQAEVQLKNSAMKAQEQTNLTTYSDRILSTLYSTEVIAEIGLSRNDSGGFVLSAALAVTITGVDQKTAEELVESAHKICPYSNAIWGNVDVGITVSAVICS